MNRICVGCLKRHCDCFENHFVPKRVKRVGQFGGKGLYTGRGSYGGEVHSNNLVQQGGSMIHRSGVAGFSGSDDETGAVVIKHREYITDIFGPAIGQNFQCLSFPLNPALDSVFPFLAQVAQNFDEYEFLQMVWEYRSTTTDIGSSTTGQCGTIIMATNYNSASAPFSDKGQMMEYAHAHSCKVTEHMVHGVECDPTKNAMSPILFTRSNPVVSGQDLKTYDLGLFQLAIANSPPAYTNLPIGELWVEYSVRLRKPKLFATRGLDISKDLYYTSSNITSCNFLSPFGTSSNTLFLSAQQNNIGCQVVPGVKYSYVSSSTTTATQAQVSQTSATSTADTALSCVIPASFNGNLRVTFTVTGIIATNPTYGTNVLNFTPFGNVSLLNDIYGAAGGVNSQMVTNYQATTGSLVNVSVTLTVDIYVKQATGVCVANTPSWSGQNANLVVSSNSYYCSGGNNGFNIGGITISGNPAVAVSVLSIEQYAPLGGTSGIVTGLNRVIFVNQSGVVTVPS